MTPVGPSDKCIITERGIATEMVHVDDRLNGTKHTHTQPHNTYKLRRDQQGRSRDGHSAPKEPRRKKCRIAGGGGVRNVCLGVIGQPVSAVDAELRKHILTHTHTRTTHFDADRRRRRSMGFVHGELPPLHIGREFPPPPG